MIDFDAQPLADSEVFLITGKTGAGKSTILDAICLALFADTPRLDGTQMQGETKDVDNRIGLDDPRQLMRRNTGEAFVTLTFIGSNGLHYESTWKVWRESKQQVEGIHTLSDEEILLCSIICLARGLSGISAARALLACYRRDARMRFPFCYK